MHRAEGRRALVDRGQERVGHVRRLLGDQRVGAVQRHIGDHAEEARPPPPRHHVAAHGHVLKATLAVELDRQPLGKRAADDNAELVGAFGIGLTGRQLLTRGGEGVEFSVR